jgi:hypothetical protein
MGWTIGVLEFDSRRGLGIFLFTTVSRPALGPTQPPIQWVQGALSLGVKRPVREADHSPPSSAEVKNAWSYTSTPPIRFHGEVIFKHRDNFYILIVEAMGLIHAIYTGSSINEIIGNLITINNCPLASSLQASGLKYKKLYFHLLFCMGVKLDLSH